MSRSYPVAVAQRPSSHRLRHAQGFTLIEVLVVVAIIALLVAILLPSLQRARRQTRVVLCSSNIGQIARGMITYTHESKGRYAPHVANYPNQVQFQKDMRPFPDFRRLMYERFASKQANVLWCPLISTSYYFQPANSDPKLSDPEDQAKWSKVFFVGVANAAGVGYGGNPSYMSGYSVFAGLTANPNPKAGEPKTYTQSWSWDYAGNLDRNAEPRQAASPRDVIISDVNESWPRSGLGTPLKPYRTFHCETPEPQTATPVAAPNRFTDTNVGFGDGSAQNRKRLRNYVGRDGVGSSATGCYSY